MSKRCWWLEGGLCYVEPCKRDISGRSLKKCEGIGLCQLDKSGIPAYDSIDAVANKKAKMIDWDDDKDILRYEGIYADGFIAGALWMKRKYKGNIHD